jgi:hypothetical protein
MMKPGRRTVKVDGVRGGHRGMTASGWVRAVRGWSRKGKAGGGKGDLGVDRTAGGQQANL